VPPEVSSDPSALVDFAAKYGAYYLRVPPIVMREIFRAVPDLAERLPKLRVLAITGESLSADLKEEFKKRLPGVELSSVYACTEAQRFPVNTQTFVVDSRLQLVPDGVVGEILCGGWGTARGYLNQPELTAQRFIRDPFSRDNPNRFFRTGDLGRYRANQELE